MKALLGSLAKIIKSDSSGNQQLRQFISSSSKESTVITLSNGKKYRVSTHSPKENVVA
ncbi:hypothetical protein MTF66_02570 [Pseudoalteromonas sp. 2CM39R]|uniref:hypothetical protein n=1 Tax=Pseudoalteromonas sp. 2CM39R TaxID=2929856 RepID=UPI0020BD82EF|nr:hypothetical protein [Pseudoalteromonas sp. 2CM39R]MCK8123866.1 hypothetical protein [Pseudoalteromonas sp. 2CM39R]